MAKENDHITIWGNGSQTRSFLYIDECLEGMERLIKSSYSESVNLGSSEMVTIQALAEMIIDISGKDLKIKNIEGPQGVDIRTSNNKLISQTLDWAPTMPLRTGVAQTYSWILDRITHQ